MVFNLNELVSHMDNVWQKTSPKVESVNCQTIPDDSGTTLYVTAPGYSANDLKVEVEGNVLKISGSISKEKLVTDLISPGFNSYLTIPPYHTVGVTKYENGILSVRLDKENKSKTLSIPIQS